MNDEMFIQPVKIAVIDDNKEFGAGLKMLLTKEGVEVHTATDGLEGLKLLKQLLPDIVLLDVVMPGMDGIEVCKRIRQIPELMGTHIVMFSGVKTQTDQMSEGLEAGADDYITRPIPNRELLARLRVHIRLKRTEKALQKLNTNKDKFFNIIAHDLRSPFNSIIGLSELFVEQVEAKDYEGIDKYAIMIKQSANRAMNLLMNLLEWSRTQTGWMEFNPVHFELAEIIKESMLLLEDSARKKSISIKEELPHNSILYADKAMINTVIRNLLSNAIKFTKQGGEVVITAENGPKGILVSVKDNGIGISAGRIEKLFRIDESDSTSGTNNEKGTGLGLILCKEFVEKHGGKIWVESIENKGTVFTFTLPGKPG